MLNPVEANMNQYNTQMGYSLPLSGTTEETMLPPYNSWIVDTLPVKSESGLTYNLPVQRKRTRESLTSFLSYKLTNPQPRKNSDSFSFLGEDISLPIEQQRLDDNRVISQHMAKVRMEVEEKRKRQARWILEAIEFGVLKKLKSKDEEMEKIGKLNWQLEERVKSLCVENQEWRDLAQSNEATAHALRVNLEQVLAQVKVDRTHGMGLQEEVPRATSAFMEDAQSCCGSNDGVAGWSGGERREMEELRTLAGEAHEKDEYDEGTSRRRRCSHGSRLCRSCGKEECCVLILPCRHLCLCTVCGSTLHTCPICKSIKNASVHVNMS